ncbi:hypothetical protein G6F60_005103 [Rhizopus arrhizus]|nr:hypothetical protein G6F61_005180 [Rhizopus arrhizus]KAG1403344.1 hypothetical protein G6F60_005103 [Rhizopus arrhizus]
MNSNLYEYNPIYPSLQSRHSPMKKKDVEIDNSVYQLLAFYLNTDKLELPSFAHTKQRRSVNRVYESRCRNWLGEVDQDPLERNTVFNSKRSLIKLDESVKTSKARYPKSVSFDEAVTIIPQADEEEEDIFVDAVETI